MLIHRGLERVLCDLAEIGYDAEWQIIGADEVGAWHKEKESGLWRTPDANMERKRSYKNMKSRIERKMPLNLNDQLNAIEKGLLPEPKEFSNSNSSRLEKRWRTESVQEKVITAKCDSEEFSNTDSTGKHQVGTIGEWGGSGNH